ncbi:MAG: hypothetical protein ACFFFC_15150 [Candidatus Thorarchaeota archaeon]
MSSPWRSKKAFLYFGGAFVIILGGIIVLSAPYNIVIYRASVGERMPFTVRDVSGYYPQLEISVDIRASSNITAAIAIDFTVQNDESSHVYTMNFTLTSNDVVPGSNPPTYVSRQMIDVVPGQYTITLDRANETALMDIGFTQMTDSRLFIVTGGSLNILGLIMGGTGWFLTGSFLPTGDEMIVDWGYEEEENQSR